MQKRDGVLNQHSGKAFVAEENLYYTIQDVSQKLGIPIQKLRRWDQEGVLKAQRSFGGRRRNAAPSVRLPDPSGAASGWGFPVSARHPESCSRDSLPPQKLSPSVDSKHRLFFAW